MTQMAESNKILYQVSFNNNMSIERKLTASPPSLSNRLFSYPSVASQGVPPQPQILTPEPLTCLILSTEDMFSVQDISSAVEER